MKSLNSNLFRSAELEDSQSIVGGARNDTCWTEVVYENCTIDPCGQDDDDVHMENDGESQK